jgi:hypothetical protein
VTASKKLKKLEARLFPAGLAGLVETVDSYEAKQELACVLPLLVAVVEAAERLDHSLQTDPWTKLDVALAALDEALT